MVRIRLMAGKGVPVWRVWELGAGLGVVLPGMEEARGGDF
jgi:hypothetical protein